MGTLVRQELYKIYKKKSTLILFGILIMIMIFVAFMSSKQPDILVPADMFIAGYSAFGLAVFILIIQAGTIITMEFEHGTIKNLLLRNHSRTQVLISKWITLFIYTFILYGSTTLIAIILKMTFNSDLSFSQTISGNMSAIQTLLGTAAGTFVNVWLLMSLVLLLSTIFRNTAVSVASGIIFYFVASIVSGILFLAIERWEWLKWNPFNMINLSNQMIQKDIEAMTHLTIPEMLGGSFVYIAVFLFLVYVVFQKRNV